MQDAVQPRQIIRFSIFEVDLEAGELRRNGRKVRLTGQPFQILAILLEHAGRVVTREALRKRLWPDTVVEVEHSLNTAINKMREALGDSAESPRFIETLPRIGYRFIAPVCTTSDAETPKSDEPYETTAIKIASEAERRILTEPRIAPWHKLSLIVLGTAVLIGALAVTIWYLRSPLPPARITDYVQLTNDGRARSLGGADATRLFVNVFDPDELAQISISDGRSTPFRLDILDAKQCGSTVPTLRGVSPDGSWVLVLCSVGLYDNQVWIVGSLGRPSRLLVNAQDATWSADGEFVVYSTDRGAIYRIPSGGGESSLLVPAMVHNGQVKFLSDLACAPNGQSIRFTMEEAIWEVSANGENLHRILSFARWPLPSCCGHWTPDGDFFIFIYGDSPFYHNLIQHASEMWAIDERHGWLRRPKPDPVQLTSGPLRWADVVPSRDGRRLFSRAVTVRGELVRYDRQSKRLVPYLGSVSAAELAFSRDGKYVAFVTFPDGLLWRANLDGSGVIQLTQASKQRAAMPSWSPDGSEIAYLSITRQGRSPLWVIPSTGGSPRQIFSESDAIYNDPNWSPDGQRIVLGRFPADVNFPINISDIRIEILELETHQVSIIPDSNAIFSPRWSPDGRYIAALALPDSELRIYDLKTRKWLPIAKAQFNYPAWSRDSRFVYGLVYEEKRGVYRIPITGGPVELVLDLAQIRQTGWWGFWFGLDPMDAPLVLRDAGAYEIYALTLKRE